MPNLPQSGELPELPKKRKKTEANVTGRILSWFRENHHASCAIEIKATDTGSIPRSALQDHQEAALRAAAKGGTGLCYKISDASHSRLPFDAFMLKSVPAYVVAAFTKHGVALVIPIEQWEGARPHTRCMFKIPL